MMKAGYPIPVEDILTMLAIVVHLPLSLPVHLIDGFQDLLELLAGVIGKAEIVWVAAKPVHHILMNLFDGNLVGVHKSDDRDKVGRDVSSEHVHRDQVHAVEQAEDVEAVVVVPLLVEIEGGQMVLNDVTIILGIHVAMDPRWRIVLVSGSQLCNSKTV